MPFIRAALFLAFILATVLVAVPARWLCGHLRLPSNWIVRGVCRTALALLGVRLRVEGRAPGAARLIVANHVSWIDVLAFASAEPLCFLAKQEVAAWPVIGSLAELQATVFINRTRRRQIPRANQDMAERLRDGLSVLLFPEATTHDGARRGRFHTSHLACLRDRLRREPGLARCVAQPVAIAYSDPAAAWIGDAALLPHLWVMLRRPGAVCRLVYGAPIAVEPGFDRKHLGRELADAIEGLLQSTPLVDATCASNTIPSKGVPVSACMPKAWSGAGS